jgi:hypothetical protein
MKYRYDADNEYFVREDGLGKKFHVNSIEAHRIMTMYNLGNSIGEIRNKIKFSNPRKVTESTIKNFIVNVENGNIELSDDMPVPINDVMEITLDERVLSLEQRVSVLEDMLMNKQSLTDKVKSWIK